MTKKGCSTFTTWGAVPDAGEGDCERLTQIADAVDGWRRRFTEMAAEVVGHSDIDAKFLDGSVDLYPTSPIHATCLRAVRAGLLSVLDIPDPEGVYFAVTNRNAIGGKRLLEKGPITLGVVKTLFPFENRQLYAEIRGSLILDIVKMNEKKVLNSNFMFCMGIEYELHNRETGARPDASLTVQDVAAGLIVSTTPRIQTARGMEEVQEEEWYRAVLDKFTMENLLSRLPAYYGGIRNQRYGPGVKECILEFLKTAAFV
eukprot:m.222826 g.222826  ORF g.222826 m.222826 type:complete len:258 (+) comp15632_c0_seq2:379-1152(+)